MSDEQEAHEFTEDINDGSMCVCGIPALTHDAVIPMTAEQTSSEGGECRPDEHGFCLCDGRSTYGVTHLRLSTAEAALATARREVATALVMHDVQHQRANRLEAERDDLRARLGAVAALADRIEQASIVSIRQIVADLRAALANPPAAQCEEEAGVRALREAADDIGGWDTRSGDIEQARVEVFLHARADALAPTANGDRNE